MGEFYFLPTQPDDRHGGDGDWAFTEDGHQYFKTAGAWVQKDSAGGGSSVQGGDFFAWGHRGATDGTTGSFDFVADQTNHVGTSIQVDSSAGWISNYGYPIPEVTESGIYLVVLSVQPGGSDTAEGGIVVYDALTNRLAPWSFQGPEVPLNGGWLNCPNGSLVNVGVPLWLPATTHLDLHFTTTATAGLFMSLLIQRQA